jgi:hypothetical protein
MLRLWVLLLKRAISVFRGMDLYLILDETWYVCFYELVEVILAYPILLPGWLFCWHMN